LQSNSLPPFREVGGVPCNIVGEQFLLAGETSILGRLHVLKAAHAFKPEAQWQSSGVTSVFLLWGFCQRVVSDIGSRVSLGVTRIFA
jgi:hypothetical protein